ncbi:hypothetical protein ASF12_23125 [Paenibacillus sp. Leaf72]|nr:hypothetical protein ASF12_23125 [Paenibacillus sp. Leaf72]
MFNEGKERWSHEQFDELLAKYKFDPDTDDAIYVMMENNIAHDFFNECYWNENNDRSVTNETNH